MELEIVNSLNRNNIVGISRETEQLNKLICNVIDKSSDYILKAMPIQENLKDILIDLKKSLKSKSFSKVIETAITSSIREGLEIVKMPVETIKDLSKIKDIALKGGLKEAICASIDIVANKYIKNNIFGDLIIKFADDIKKFINSKMFVNKIDKSINKTLKGQEDFKSLCSNWYNAYDKMDFDSLNKIFNEMKSKNKSFLLEEDDNKNFKIISNMCELINNKKDKLTQAQLDICKSV